MPTIDLDRFTLIDSGLRTLTSGIDTSVGEGQDVVEAFKSAVLRDGVRLSDPALRAAIADAKQPMDLATTFISGKRDDAVKLGLDLGPETGALAAIPGGGFMRPFGNADVFWHSLFGVHIMYGAIAAKWRELGGPSGFLGYPTTDILTGQDPRGEGQFAHFASGSIFYKAPPAAVVPPITASALSAPRAKVLLPSLVAGAVLKVQTSVGAFEVHGAIREKYLALGAEASLLGYPRTDETGTPDGVGRFNHFEGGSIYWTPTTTAHEVHGLIRERWAALGLERDPQLGYPLSDELIPDRRIGHRHPEVLKKPIAMVPGDVVKLPAEAAEAGFPKTMVNGPPPMSVVFGGTTVRAAIPPAVTASVIRESVPPAKDLNLRLSVGRQGGLTTIDPGLLKLDPTLAASLASSHNRFSDFQSGVLFWFRGHTAAVTLNPSAKASDGTDVGLTGAQVAQAVLDRMNPSTFAAPPMHAKSIAFVGVTDYSHDGAQTHNRRHRLQLTLSGVASASDKKQLGIPIPGFTLLSATVELLIEVLFAPDKRSIVFMPVDWSIVHATPIEALFAVEFALHASVDPLLWTEFGLVDVPDTDDGAPIAVLSVKTMPNGNVAVFFEPDEILHLPLGTIFDPVMPVVLPISPRP